MTTHEQNPAGNTAANTDLPAICLGYLVPEFPSQTHAFFWREICAMRELGAQVHLLSSSRPRLGAARHAFAEAAAAETEYLFPADLPSYLSLLMRPLRLMRAARYVFGLAQTPLPKRLVLLALIPSAARLVRAARRSNFHHVHIHSCANSAHLGALARILGGISYSLTLHGDLPVYGTDHESKMRTAAFVACVTRPLQQQVISAMELPAEKVPVLWMGVDLSRFTASRPQGASRGAIRAVSVARLNRAKGHVFALRALSQLRTSGIKVTYLIAGEGEYREEIASEVHALAMQDVVEFLGSIAEAEVAALMARSDVLLLTSIGMGEAAPVAVMEAMASGLPVVASIIGGTPDMITDGVDGFLCPQEDTVAIATKLRLLAADPELRAGMGAHARLRAERDFDAKKLAGRLLRLVEQATRVKTT